ncbi:putative glycerophosphoryl diester phosphodiesterase 1 [Apostasia shenzhenica]|uniref:glycerophosphodiester phosphodiesterase n=1 Tax=Apostasia shenzhenica TaxID=1088818 RepID=A0A2I0B3N6_9ASPA|nr:putative glycerophosphoryl diester phosphodiesterase 1 [Apostasia shenzhenica]
MASEAATEQQPPTQAEEAAAAEPPVAVVDLAGDVLHEELKQKAEENDYNAEENEKIITKEEEKYQADHEKYDKKVDQNQQKEVAESETEEEEEDEEERKAAEEQEKERVESYPNDHNGQVAEEAPATEEKQKTVALEEASVAEDAVVDEGEETVTEKKEAAGEEEELSPSMLAVLCPTFLFCTTSLSLSRSRSLQSFSTRETPELLSFFPRFRLHSVKAELSEISASSATMGGKSSGRGVAPGIAAFLIVLQWGAALNISQATKSSTWRTLSGDPPAVVAKGGFSGLFPDSTDNAYKLTYLTGSTNTISWCDVQLTKDGIVIQGVQYRSDKFDGNGFHVLHPEDVSNIIGSAALWLNIQHDAFFKSQNLSMRSYLLSLSKSIPVSYISSPEVAFLSGIAPRYKATKTKLFLRLLGEDITEPSTNQTYGSLLKNLTFIKTFASGILVPKNYIWPTTVDQYLQPHTSIVSDAHREGLEVFASDFANDAALSYNYSYDPLAEVLSFVDNGNFSVDGVLTEFPITASAAIGCYSHIRKNVSEHENLVVISHNGASGVYPDCTDLAYQQAVEDGADFIDCPVQLTRDGIPICSSSINLMDNTNAVTSILRSRLSLVPEIQTTPGIFTFNLSWEEIKKSLKPVISTPDKKYRMLRNPLYRNAGSFMKLSDFLAFAKSRALSGVLISIEDAAFYAEKIGYGVTDAVITALKDSGYSNQTTQQVMLQSANSSVLMKFKKQTSYKLVYMIGEPVSNLDKSSLSDIKQFADAVAISKQSVYPASQLFVMGQTDVVKTLQSSGLPVYAYLFRNEFVSQPWDFFSDASVEINSFFQRIGVDGVITDYPGTAVRYRRNSCLKLGDKQPNYMKPVAGGELLVAAASFPPALAPMPVLDASDVVEPPLPAVSSRSSTNGSSAVLPTPSRGWRATEPPLPPAIFLLFSMIGGMSLLI